MFTKTEKGVSPPLTLRKDSPELPGEGDEPRFSRAYTRGQSLDHSRHELIDIPAQNAEKSLSYCQPDVDRSNECNALTS